MEQHKKTISTRSYLVFLIVLLAAILVLARIFYLFLGPGPELRDMAEQNAYRSREITGMRGNIFSSDEELIAASVPVFTIRWDYDPLKKRIPGVLDTLATGLAEALPGSKSHYLKKLNDAVTKKNRYYKVYSKADYEQIKKIRTSPIFCEGRNKSGLIEETSAKRQKPYQELAFRTIGHDREGTKNDVGIEGAYSEYLSGEKTSRLEKRISGGMYSPIESKDNVEPKNGYDIVTTLNMRYQDVAEDALKRHLIEQRASEGCAVLMEVHTGHILAIANQSTRTGEMTESYNVALGNSMEPGSTFKLATVLALLDDKLVDIHDTVIITNSVKYYYGERLIDSHINKGEFTYTLESAFKESSNAAISWYAQKYYGKNPQRFIEKLQQFNLDKKQGIEIPGEPTPLIKNTAHPQWSGLSLPWMSVGYELLISPLQILGFYNAVANDGVYVKPILVKEIREGRNTIYKTETEILSSRIASPEAVSKAQYLLEEVVNEGTGKIAFRNSPYPVAGKTGTAQIHSGSEGYRARQYNASFIGYFPADKPKYSCIVVVNRPGAGSYYASSVAIPVFKEIADKVYASDISIHNNITDSIFQYSAWTYGYMEDLKNISSTMNYNVVDDKAIWGSMTIETDGKVITRESTLQKNRVPNLKGLGLRDAIFMAESVGMKVHTTGKGRVASQEPAAGTAVTTSNIISITLN